MENRHAVRVCRVCSQRKKTCDKALPSCGFCSSRGLPCSYDEPLQRERRTKNYNPGRFFVPVEDLEQRSNSNASPAASASSASSSAALSSQASQPSLLHSHRHHHHHHPEGPAKLDQPSSRSSTTPALRDPLVEHVYHLLQAVGLGSPDEVSRRFHRVSYQWPPIVPPRLRYHHQLQDTSVDQAALLLAMALLVAFPELPKAAPEAHPLRSKRSFYESVKSVYGLAQASSSAAGASLPLLQAGLLIATCEYVSVRPGVAHVTLGSCRAMLHVLDPPAAAGVGGVAGEAEDWWNVRWTLSMLERIIVCELLPRNIQPATEDPAVFMEQIRRDGGEPGRQLEAVAFLDQVLVLVHQARADPDAAFPRLRDLDVQIQTFLKVAVDEDPGRIAASLPAAIPLATRALLLLNLYLADYARSPNSRPDEHTLRKSQATLGMLSRMGIDLVRYGFETWSTPICCYYNLDSAMGWFQEAKEEALNPPSEEDMELLSGILYHFRDKWMM